MYEDLFAIMDNYEEIIVDIGNVILEWDSVHEASHKIPGVNDLREMTSHPLWQDLEKGFINREIALTLLSNELHTPYLKLNEIIQLSMNSLRANQSMIAILKALRKKGKKIICLSNMDRDSFYFLHPKYDFWNLFDDIYVSWLLQLNKPGEEIFQYVITSSKLDPKKTIFIDDELENLPQASRFGIDTIQLSKGMFDYHENDQINIALPVDKHLNSKKEKGETYLHNRLQRFPFCRSFMGDNVQLIGSTDFSREIFSTAVILHTCSSLPQRIINDMSQEILAHSQGRLYWCFYTKEAKPEGFPEDLDTTSMVLSFLLTNKKLTRKEVLPVAEHMINNRNKNGVIQVYFDDKRPRVDAIVTINVLYLMYQIGWGQREELQKSIEFVYDYLVNKTYLEGTRYYPSPDVFLFFLSRLVTGYPDDFTKFFAPLKENLLSRVNSTTFSAERAFRVIALKKLGIANRIDFLKMLDEQLEDGGWPMYGLFIAAKSKTYFGSRELSSSFALEALTVMS